MTTNDQPMDHVPSDGTGGKQSAPGEIEKNVTAISTWLRLLFMVIIALLYAVSRMVLGVVAITQFFFVLFTGDAKEDLKRFGHSLAIYSYQITRYLTFNSDDKPFPFDLAWPDSFTDD